MRIPLRQCDLVQFAVLSAALWAAIAIGQEPPMHYRHAGLAPPGAIGSVQLQRGGPLPFYFQPIEIRAPETAKISIASQGQFGPPLATPLKVGFLVAPVYRLKLSNIPGHEGQELFPTIEVIDRLYPPRGHERRFSIPVELNADDIELALEGNFVTRVVYLEDPTMALPVAEGRLDQHWFDAGPGINAVEEADRWGRPLAIVRIGGRVPDDQQGPDVRFIGGNAPFTLFRPPADVPVEPREPGETPMARRARQPSLLGGLRR